MTHSTNLRMLTLVLAAALAGCASPVAPDRDLGEPASIAQAPASVVITESDVAALVATPLKDVVELGEPVYLALRITNDGAEPITIIGDLRPGDGLVEIFVRGPADRSATRLTPLSQGDFENTMTLAPGDSAGDVMPIFFGADGWNFTEPGVYQIYAELQVPEGRGYAVFRSAPTALNIADSAAGRMLLNADRNTVIEAGKFLLWRSGDHLRAGQDHLTAVAKQYRDASLAAYIDAAFIRSFSEPFANYTVGEVRPPDCARADALRSELNYEALTQNLIIEDALSRAKCAAESENWDEAAEALNDAAALAEGRPEFSSLARAAADMQKNLAEALQ